MRKKRQLSSQQLRVLNKAKSDTDLRFCCNGIEGGKLVLTPLDSTLCIYDEKFRKSTIIFCNSIALALSRYEVSLLLDFSAVKSFSAAASVLVFAEITRWQLAVGDNVLTCKLPKDKDMLAQFVSSGFWSAIKPGASRKLERIAREHSPYSTNTIFDRHMQSTIKAISADDLSYQDLQHFQRGLQEAVLNVMHHAYITPPVFGNRWWQLCYHDVSNRKIYVIVHDRGEGIPETISKVAKVPGAALMLSPLSMQFDSYWISRAMTRGVTRYVDKKHRGQGSEDLKRPVENIKSAITSLAVWSGRGEWFYSKDEVTVRDFEFPISGTMVEWLYEYGTTNDEN